MQQITEYCDTKEELQFAVDQVAKHGGEAVFKSKVKNGETVYCVVRVK